MRVALGLKARTGRAILVAIGVSRELQVLARSQFLLLPAGAFAPYHAAEGLPAAAARQSVERSIAAAHRLAEEGIRRAVEAMTEAGHEVCGSGLLVANPMPPWSTDEILAVHVRMHQAEGQLFRDVLVAGSRACGLAATSLREKTALDDAASSLGLDRTDLEARLAALGKTVGPPWGKDQKEAAAAAIVALGIPADPEVSGSLGSGSGPRR
jgi:hypothetical protein